MSGSGQSIMNQGQRMTERMSDGVYTGTASNKGVQGGAKAVQFRRKFDTRDAYDDEMNQKMQLMDKDGMTPFGQVYYDDKVGRWLERKEAAAESANFDAYFNREFNVNDLAARQWAQQIHPEFYDSREQEMNERADLVVTLKKIQLRGPQTEEDLKMLYLIESGRVKLPKDWDKIGAGFSGKSFNEEQKEANEENFRFGLIRMPKILTQVQRKNRAVNNSNFGAWGNEEASKNTFPSGAKVPKKQNVPLASRAGGKTVAFNFQNFLKQ